MKDTKGLLFLDWLEVDWLHSCALTHAGVGLRAAEARSEKERKGFEEFVFFILFQFASGNQSPLAFLAFCQGGRSRSPRRSRDVLPSSLQLNIHCTPSNL